MSESFRSIGTTLGVSASAPATYDASGYGALTFTTVGGVSSIGEFGASFEQVTHVDLDDGETQKDYGTKNAGDPSVVYRIIPSDAGQGILETAEGALNKISIKVTRPNGLIQYAQAIVQGSPMSEASGSNTQVVTVTLGCERYVKDSSGV